MRVSPNPPRRTTPFGPAVSPDVLRAVLDTQRAAKAERIPCALVGGFALRVYGSTRLPETIELAMTRLPRSRGVRFWSPQGIEINLIVHADAPELFADAVKRARRTRWQFRLATAEHLAAMKLMTGRPQDEPDLTWLLENADLDVPKLRRLVKRFLGARLLRDLDTRLGKE